MKAFDADVIVVGCGPVGVMAALRCAQRGLSVIAVDRSTEIYPLPRALGMDDETQDVFSRAGLLGALRANTVPLPGAEFLNAAGEHIVGIEIPEGMLGSLGHPMVVTFNQPALESALRDAAIDAGVEIRLGLDAYAIAQTDRGVRIDLTDSDGDVSLDGRWLIAADGAKSTVRSLTGIAMVDQGFDQTWLVVDTTLRDPDLQLPRLAQQICDPARVHTFVPGPGDHRRWEFQLSAEETREEALSDEAIQRLLAPWGTPHQLQIDRAAVYRFHATVAERFRAGRVFLAGDAAHQMPPFNGQGMCTGIRDAENLAWKLAHVAQGIADESLLATYDEERRPHATGQVAHSVDAGLLMQAIASDGEAALESGYGQRPFPTLEGEGFVASHPAVGTIRPNLGGPSVGANDGWTVLTADTSFSCSAEAELLDAEVLVVDEAAMPGLVADDTTVVVRPDHYIAAVTTDPQGTLRTLASWSGRIPSTHGKIS